MTKEDVITMNRIGEKEFEYRNGKKNVQIEVLEKLLARGE